MKRPHIKTVLGSALLLFGAASVVNAQQAAPPAPAAQAPVPAPDAKVLRAESRVVRVDVVVTDKKGNYIHDLTADDFHVFDNNQEQKVVNFSFGSASGTSGPPDRRYMVLFFDDSTMDFGDQARARDAAQKFIDANAGPDRVMAVVDFTGTLRIIQNFTADATRLKQAAASMKPSAVSASATDASFANSSVFGAGLALPNAESEFGVYTLLLGIRSLARNLTDVPGRKSVVLFTDGFPLTPEAMAELTATISACNQANVAIYPLDVRGLIAVAPGAPGAQLRRDDGTFAPSLSASAKSAGFSAGAQPRFVLASYPAPVAAEPADPPQKGGGGGGGHGGGGGGGVGGGGGGGGKGGGGSPGGGSPGGGRSGGGGTTGTMGGGMPGTTNPGGIPPEAIMPPIPDNGSASQDVLYALATGTGGFPMVNSNDLLGGLTKIANEQNEYYFLGYSLPDAPEGSCHALRVKLDRSGLQARSRSGYCTAKSKDMLAGKQAGKDLESRAAGSDKGTIGGTLEAPFFYTSPNEARVNVAMEFPASAVDFSKDKGKYHGDMNVLGIAYRPDGTVAARFSDEVTLDLEKDEWKQFTQQPTRYSNQFPIAPGKYRLTIVLSAGGQNFGKYETPLVIDPYDGKTFIVSAIALSNQFAPVQGMGGALEADLLSDHAPLIVNNTEIVPSASNHFKKSDVVTLYAQVYAPHLAEPNPPAVHVDFNVVDVKTGKVLGGVRNVDTTPFIQKGNTVVPLGLRLPLEQLPPGSYRLDLQVSDASGARTPVRSVGFESE